MTGAILGDIAGSRFEFSKPSGFNYKKVELFGNNCFFTDDTVLTIATKYALLNDISYAKAYGKFGRMYRDVGYGTMFQRWLDGHAETGYGSFGNGAMCTHNHIEGLKAAVATAGLIYLALHGERKKDLKKYFNKEFEYPVHKPLWAYRPKAKFDATAEGTMPLAFRCFMESEDWESCIRNVFSVKCDTDTVACIAGGIAGAYYKRTVENEKDLLKRYLIKPDKRKVGEFDRFLYDWATK